MNNNSNNYRSQFLLDPEVVFLNHGSFGACPREVFETYQRWQLELERQPVEFLGRRADDLLHEARVSLGKFVHTDSENLIYVQNATTGLNTVIRSLPLKPGDEILTTNHEYNALNLTWKFVCGKTGARYINHPIPLPVTSAEEFIESIWSAVTPRTRVLYLSHMTSPTALIFPIAELCRRAREAGILSIIDGAHVPGHIPLDLDALGADFYSGNCHKWLCSAKGSALLYVRPEHQAMVEPLVVSHGWTDDATFISRLQWEGTRDIAPFLSVPAAIEYRQKHDWANVHQRCHELAREARRRIAEMTGIQPIAPDSPDWFGQMVAAPVPATDMEVLKRRLYDEYHIEVPVFAWNEWHFVRVSFQAYNTQDDLECLLTALATLLPKRAN